jgi:hypothetical protein
MNQFSESSLTFFRVAKIEWKWELRNKSKRFPKYFEKCIYYFLSLSGRSMLCVVISLNIYLCFQIEKPEQSIGVHYEAKHLQKWKEKRKKNIRHQKKMFSSLLLPLHIQIHWDRRQLKLKSKLKTKNWGG